jgi:ATP-dependent DNA ligase
MLATSAHESQLEELLSSPNWVLEQKLDGHRTIITLDASGKVAASSRTGKQVAVPHALLQRLSDPALPRNTVLDGELLGSEFYAFDLLRVVGKSTTDQPWEVRRSLLGREAFQGIQVVNTYRTEEEKRYAFERCLDREGVMFKRTMSTYCDKRSSDWLKWKFVKTCDAVVIEMNRGGKREAFTLGLFDENGNLRDVGGCRLLPQFDGHLDLGDVVEVKYLYASDDLRLVQPILLGVRTDKVSNECTLDQLVTTIRSTI